MQKILVYGDSNSWGWVPGKMGAERFDAQTRWPAVMRAELGAGYEIIEENLGARTTNLDEPRPELPLRNGLQTLPIVLETHAPIDTVIFMLGTADCKPLFDVSPESISEGMSQLIRLAKPFKAVNGQTIKRIIVVAPPIIDDTAEFAKKVYTNARPKTESLVSLYKQLAEQTGCEYIDCNPYVVVDPEEGIHISADSHRTFGKQMAQVVSEGM